MIENKKEITGDFEFVIPNLTPSFVQGEDAKAVYDEARKTIPEDNFRYNDRSKTVMGSSTFSAARIDSILRGLNKGLRVATLRDLSRPEIMEMVRERFYSDTPAIIFRSIRDGHSPNTRLIEQLAPLIEQKNGKLEFPLLITGFDVVTSEDKRGYGLDIVARDDFEALHDERLSGKYNPGRFSSVDEKGLPNFDKNGKRVWSAYSRGISRLFLDGDFELSSNSGFISCYHYPINLASSNDAGRIIIVREQ